MNVACHRARIRFAAFALSAALAACSSQPVQSLQSLLSPSKGKAALDTGLKQYEEGDYADSAKSLAAALDLGLTERESANAHKHLAFMHCAASRERLCRDEFRKALAADPALDLSPAEAGHPMWGPVFRAVKAQGSR
ncbi:MAG: TssQ family T6SS-associated lipoprotein [Betaproteobacteria bacterium]|nr:TssQ family T6SS-associated lipoprotein [Betaproteobacteria bacterium]